jgi:hypothetical protein
MTDAEVETALRAWRERWNTGPVITWPTQAKTAMIDLLATVTALVAETKRQVTQAATEAGRRDEAAAVGQAVTRERERCAEIAEEWWPQHRCKAPEEIDSGRNAIAAAIRQVPRPVSERLMKPAPRP